MGAQGSRLLKGLRPTQTREYCCKTLPADLAPRKLGALAGLPKGTCRSNAKDFRGRKKPHEAGLRPQQTRARTAG